MHYPMDSETLPLDTPLFVNKFSSVCDSLQELESYLTRLHQLHSSTTSFNESFSAFLYGLSITMWCVDIPNYPSQKEWKEQHQSRKVNERIGALRAKISQAKIDNIALKSKLEESTLDHNFKPRFKGLDSNKGKVAKQRLKFR